MLMSEVDEQMAINESGTWYDSYGDVVAAIGSGFSLYSLIPLMTISGARKNTRGKNQRGYRAARWGLLLQDAPVRVNRIGGALF
jgi:hypothetical protein